MPEIPDALPGLPQALPEGIRNEPDEETAIGRMQAFKAREQEAVCVRSVTQVITDRQLLRGLWMGR